MGYLWANMEKIDVQAEREKTRKAIEALEATRAEVEATQAEVEATQAENIRLRALLAKHGIVQNV